MWVKSLNEIVKCEECGARFPNNPNKHRYRSKYCPQCRAPYTNAQTWMPSISFRSIRRGLQKLFSFFPKRSHKEIYYQCPRCGHLAYGKNQFKITRYPDKTKEVVVDGKVQVVPITYRDVPTCPECNTHLTRKSRK